MRANQIPVFLALTAGVIAGLAVLPTAQAQTSKKPNIVFILTDNLGYGEIGCYGGGLTRGAATPRIDVSPRKGFGSST